MELLDYLVILRRRLWIVVTVPLVSALTAAVLSLFVITPVYQASTTLWVVKKESSTIDYQTLLLYRNLTKTYGEVAKSRAVMQKAIDRLGLPYTVEELQKATTVTPVRDTEIIRIAVEDTDPKRAADTANAISDAFMQEIQRFIRLDNVGVVDAAQVPDRPERPKPLLNTAIALALGLMTAAGLVFLVENLDTSIRTPADVQRHLSLPVLGVIPVIEPAKAGSEGPAEVPAVPDVQANGSQRRRRPRPQGATAAMTGPGGDEP